MSRSLQKITSKVDDTAYKFSPAARCFICDGLVKNNGVQIILGRTPYSNVGLPAKIGQLIGDNFVVFVGVSDKICAQCASLISQLDKLETDACTVKKTLMGYIVAKYQLDHDVLEECAKIDTSKVDYGASEDSSENTTDHFPIQQVHQNCKKKSQVSLLIANKKNQMKTINCENCNFSTKDVDALQIHSALCPVKALCSNCGGSLDNCCDQLNEMVTYLGTCEVCSGSFHSEKEFEKHMTIHTTNCDKCTSCNFTSTARDVMYHHIFSHSSQSFQCNLCQAVFTQRNELDEHVRGHMIQNMCPKCSIELSQTKISSETELVSICLNENIPCADAQIESKGRMMSDYMESLMGVDGFDPDASNIEFHPCPNCGLTFLNKMLFTEHMKMHNEKHNQNSSAISGTHEDVLKSASVSVVGDCSIDDDLEDLFEKLHAETTNLVSDQLAFGKSSCLNYPSVKDRSSVESLKDNDMSLGTSSAVSSRTKISKMTSIIDKSSQTIIESDKNCLKTNLEEMGFSAFGPASSSRDEFFHSQEPSSDVFVSTEQQTYIYIDNGAGCDLPDCDSQGAIHLQNARKDSNSGNIHLLPYAICEEQASEVQSTGLVSPVLESDVSNSVEITSHGQNNCKEKPEPNPDDKKLCAVQVVNDRVLSCNQCSFQTSIELVLKRHSKIHKANLVQKCSICNRVFSSTHKLLSHLDLRHSNAGPINCPSCSEIFDSSVHLRKHLAENHRVGKNTFSCRFCSRKFSTKKTCITHEESHSEIFRFQCKICLKKFASVEECDDHVEWDHDKLGQCRFCGKKIDKPKSLKNHELRHMQESIHHECHECKRVFKTKTGLRHHVASHTGEFKYCCDFCGRGFMSRMMLEEHRSCHTKEERYVCDVCGQKFTFQSTYWIHRKWHETPYPYKCNYCGRFFKHSSLLAVHKRKHTGERPYKCPHCPLTFPVSGTLKRHIILHTGAYPFSCETCKRGFTARHKYASHVEKVHGIGELSDLKSAENSSEENLNGKSGLESAKGWDLNSITLSDAESAQVLNMMESSSVCKRDPLISDQNIQSRVVEIVMDESYQPVATVTLGGSVPVIPENWYE